MVEQAHDGEAGEVGAPVFEFVSARGDGPDIGRAVGFNPGAEGVDDLVVGEVAPLDLDEGDFVGGLAVGAKIELRVEGWGADWVRGIGGLVDGWIDGRDEMESARRRMALAASGPLARWKGGGEGLMDSWIDGLLRMALVEASGDGEAPMASWARWSRSAAESDCQAAGKLPVTES